MIFDNTKKNFSGNNQVSTYSFSSRVLQNPVFDLFSFDETSIHTKIPPIMYKRQAPKSGLNEGVWCSGIRIMRDREVYCMHET